MRNPSSLPMADQSPASQPRESSPRPGVAAFLMQLALLALVHFAASRLGLALQLGDNFGSPFWPAAGIALAGLMIGGLRLWPAIAVAAFAEAFWTLSRVEPPLGVSTIVWVSLAAAFGKTLQAIVGAWLVRGTRPGFAFPAGDRELVRMFLAAGVLGSTVNATVGAMSFLAAGIVDSGGAVQVWLTTWAGDAAGVFLVVPLLLLWFAAPRADCVRRVATFGGPLIVFMLVVTVVATQIHSFQTLREQRELDRRSSLVVENVRAQFDLVGEMLYGVRGLFEASDHVTDDEFRQFVTVYLKRRPSLRSVGWLPRVAAEDRSAFELQASADVRPGFRVLEHRSDSKIGPASDRAEYFPLQYVEARSPRFAVHGYDIFSVPPWRAAGELALLRDEPTAALPLPLADHSRVKNGVLVLLPRYVGIPENPPKALKPQPPFGFVAVLLDTDVLLRSAVEGSFIEVPAGSNAEPRDNFQIAATLFALGSPTDPPVSVAHVGAASSPVDSELDRTAEIAFGGRTWLLRLSRVDSRLRLTPPRIWWILMGNTLSAGLIGAFTLVLASRSARIEQRVAERTSELDHEIIERRRAEALANSNSAWLELTQDAAGVGVWEWNCATNMVHASASQARLYGRGEEVRFVSGDAWVSFLHPDDQEPTREAGRLAVQNGDAYATQTRVVWPDGTIRWLQHEGRIDRDANGTPVRIVGASWDITAERKRLSEVEEQQRRFRALTENSEIGFWQVAADGRALYLNAAICRLLEIDGPDDAMQFDTIEFFAPESRETLRAEREKRRRGISSTYEATIVGRRGRRTNVMISAAPILDANGELQSTIGSYIDITELKAAEARLRASENELASIYHGVSDAVSLWKVEGSGDEMTYRCLRVNRAALATFGVDEQRIVGKLFNEAPAAIHDAFRDQARTAVETRRPVDSIETVGVSSRLRTFELRFTPLFCDAGICTHLLVAARDVTARVEAERELRRALEFRESIIAHAGEGLCVSQVIDEPPYLRFSVWNRRLEEITGYTKDDVNRLGWLTLLFQDDHARAAMQAIHERVTAGENVRDQITRIKRADGNERIVCFSTTRLTGADAEVLVLAFIADITERERAVEALRASEDRYRGVVSAMAEGILMVDEHACVEACNASLCKILGLPESQILGRHVLDLFSIARDEHGAPFDKTNCAILLALSTGVSRERRMIQLPQPDGQPRWLSANTEPIFDPLGVPRAAVATITDVTNLKLAAARLHAHEQQLAHVSRVSTMGEFVAGIAHEINQPLHAIANYASACERSLTEEGAGDEQIANALAWTRHINAGVRQAANVIRRLRDFFRRETGKREPASLAQTVRDSLELTSFLVKEHGVSIDLDLDAGDDRLTIDRVQIQQVLVNLIRNAIEAVASLPPERRRVEVRLVRHAHEIEVVVADAGPGVAPDRVARLFEPFYTTKPDGMGMGLAITKTIVESHGGEIWYQPHAAGNGHGGEFRFTLPRFVPEEVEPEDVEKPQAAT